MVNHFNVQREQLSEFVSLAFLFGAWRILNHCLEVMKFPFTSLVPNRIKPKWSSSTDFFRKAPSYSRALDFLERAGLAQLMDLSEVELCPDLDFLKGMIRLGMPLDRLALERLVVWATVRIEWRPRFETALFWLIDQGAPMSEELFAKIVNPVFRPAVFQRLLERGCPSSALAYEELVSTMYEDDTLIPQRYFLLRASNVPVPLWKSEKDRPPNQLFISAVLQQPLDVLADILEANGFKSIPPHWFNLVFYKNRDDLAPRLRAIAPLCEGRLLSTLYARVTAEQWLSLSFGLDEDWQPFLQLAIDFFTSVLPDLPLPTWPEFIRVYLSTCSQWDQVPKGRDLGWVPRLLDWFACSGRMGPVINPRDVFEDVVLLSLRPSQTRPRAYEAKVRAVCEFLRARGATIEEEEIANYLEQQQPRARTHK